MHHRNERPGMNAELHAAEFACPPVRIKQNAGLPSDSARQLLRIGRVGTV